MNLNIVELQILPNDTTIVGSNGSTVTVTCLIKNNIPGAKNISWLKNGQLVSSNASNILTVTFLLTTEVSKQNLKCKADIDCIDMPLEQDVKFSVNYPPSVKVAALPSSELNEKDNMILTCTHESYPYASFITWTKNGNGISHEAEYQKLNVSREDNGLYVCNVSNTIGYGVDKVQISVYCNCTRGDCRTTEEWLTFLQCDWYSKYLYIFKMGTSFYRRILLRTLESKIPTLLTVDTKHDKPIYTIDGRYQCNVSNGVPDEKNLTFQNGYKDVYFPGKPHCFLPKNNEQIIRKRSDTVMIAFNVYSSNITRYEWWKGSCSLNQTFEYEFTTNQSTTSVLMYGISISLNTTTIALKISNLTEAHFETQYSLFIYNEQGNSNCSMTLLEGREFFTYR
ncbi:unnamed protein product [Mytilus coruscus]|uniref:Ig-like domain-containing protein n=1 Tax=Mytilus coruscus TaxID=42192 RepID=A0A6J8BQ12_MYTCO|nr:unnamed protein product [Mytilus coruscus]